MFHDICKTKELLHDKYSYSIEEFEQFLDYNEKAGFKFVSIEELLSGNPKRYAKDHCVISFDDGYESIFSIVAPVLTKKKIPFIAYITSGYIDKEGYLSKQQIIKLSNNPLCIIGAHSHSHKMFRFMTKEEVAKDMFLCKQILEKTINKEVKHLAFPYGSFYACSSKDIKLAIKCGYKSVALTRQLPLRMGIFNDRFHLPRIDVPNKLHY